MYRRGQTNVPLPGIQGQLPTETVDCAALSDQGGLESLAAKKLPQPAGQVKRHSLPLQAVAVLECLVGEHYCVHDCTHYMERLMRDRYLNLSFMGGESPKGQMMAFFFLLVAVRFKINEKLLNFINFIEIKTKWLAKHDKRVEPIHR